MTDRIDCMQSDTQAADLTRVGLHHDLERHIIICKQHQFALIPGNIVSHLRFKHQCKGQLLHAVQDYLKTVESTLHGPSTVLQPVEDGVTKVPWIATVDGFVCNVSACSRKTDWLSKHRRTVEKHISREHGGADARSHKPTKQHVEHRMQQILPVTFQSIFARPYYVPFIIKDVQDSIACSEGEDDDNDQETTAYSQAREKDGREVFASSYDAGRDAEKQQLRAVGTEIHKSQIPPWLRSTGIAQWLSGCEKEQVFLLCSNTGEKDETCFDLIYQAVYRLLETASSYTRVGHKDCRLSRVAARAMNSFEPDRMQTRPFTPVQEISTLKRYARSWSQLIACIVRMQSIEYEEEFGEQFKQSTTQELCDEIRLVEEQMQLCYMRDPKDGEENLYETILQQSVQQLSCSLTRFLYSETPFRNLIVQYCAFRSIGRDEGWVLAATFAPFLSGMIHCMQLWIAIHCMQSVPSATDHHALEQLILSDCKQFLVNIAHSPIAELSYWRLLCWRVSNDTVLHPVTTISENLSAVTHLHVNLSFDLWRSTLRAILDQASNVMREDLLLGLHGVLRYTSVSVFDDPSNLSPGFSFLNDPRNHFEFTKDWLYRQVQASPDLSTRFLCRQKIASSQSAEPEIQFDRAELQAYLRANDQFLSLLAVLFYMTGGLPPRREELVSITWRNWDIARSIYISNGLVVLITGYHKSQWRVGNRPVARFLPHAVGDILIQYVIYITPFLRFVRHALELQPSQGFLFTGNGGSMPWSPDRISYCMQRQTIQRLGFAVTTRQWRHIAIAIDRRLLHGRSCQMYQIKESFGRRPVREPDASDSDLDGDPLLEGKDDDRLHATSLDETASHLQASHTPCTGNTVYGNSSSLLSGLNDHLLTSFRRVSRQWHDFIGLGEEGSGTQSSAYSAYAVTTGKESIAPSLADKIPPSPKQQLQPLHKRKASSTITGPATTRRLDIRSSTLQSPAHSQDNSTVSGLQIEVRTSLWTWSAIERALQQVFGPHASFKNDTQRDALRLIASSPAESLIIMPTGGGKSLLYILPTMLPGAQVTIVITPLKALQQDLADRCRQWDVHFGVYTTRSALRPTSAQPSLLLVNAELASSLSFQALLSELQAAHRLDRIVLDEAHLLLTASHYREQLPALSVLRRYRCPFICLTATLPPSAEREFRRMLCLTSSLERLRTSSDRPNLSYRICHLEHGKDRLHAGGVHASRQDILIDGAVHTCRELLQQYKGDQSARIICYVRQKLLGTVLADELDCHLYHSTLDNREQNMTAWRLGIRSPIIVATTALGAGIDYPSIRGIIHMDAPAGMLDYAQETGRAGRDGLHADCTVLLTRGWKVDWGRGFRSNFLDQDSRQMTSFLESQPPTCLRLQLTRYLNGGDGTACRASRQLSTERDEYNALCSHCIQSQSQSTSQRPTPEPMIGNDSSLGSSECSSSSESLLCQSSKSKDKDFNSDCNNDKDSDSNSDQYVLFIDSQSSAEQQLPLYSQAELYIAAETAARLQAMAAVEGLQLYERRIAGWNAACIPCSFAQRRKIRGEHDDCIHDYEAVKRLRMGIQFAKYIGCWKCGQPLNICNPQGNSACMRSTLVFDICWYALSRDVRATLDILHAAGAPIHPSMWTASGLRLQLHTDTSILQWLGKKSRLYSQEASNAARLTHFWLDRLESICI